ncbi:MAG: hypothetical protein AB2A00_41835 [Myxococcota bacterium]
MKIVGSGTKTIDADLLAKLALDRASGGSISKAEVDKTLKSVRKELKDEFESSTRGLDRASTAVANTLELAVKSGWIKGGASQDAVKEFLKGDDAGSLKATVADIRADVKSTRSGGSSYGGYSGRTSGYSGT